MSSDNNNPSKLLQTFKSIIFALIIALFIRYIFIQPFKIPSESMYPTLLVGDQILVDRVSYGVGLPCSKNKLISPFKKIKRGDVIVFRYPMDPNSKTCPNGGFIGFTSIYYIKRVIGIPGDTVSMRSNDIYINGELISKATSQTYILNNEAHDVFENSFTEDIDSRLQVIYMRKKNSETTNLDIKVPAGSFFVLGDNRDNSMDSRYWGFVPRENIIGKAFLIHFSWNNKFKNVKDILRTGRFFNTIK